MLPLRALACLTALGGAFAASQTHALEIRAVDWNGHHALLATGEIANGDVHRMAAALDDLEPLPHGLQVVLLNSGGGRVAEALKISKLFERRLVHTVIPAGAECASACASIIFVAGTNRTVEEGGRLGQHSCSRSGTADEPCNEIIAQHAVTKGVSHGSIKAFMTYAAPEDMVWFSREQADCYGITFYPFTRESGFGKSEPCVIEGIIGKTPPAQAAWRVDFKADGYRAFLRPVVDHLRELELSIFCDERVPGVLFLSMDIAGSAALIKDALIRASLHADPIDHGDINSVVSQASPKYSRMTVRLERHEVMPFLTKSNALLFSLYLKPPYEPTQVSTFLLGSRKALLFAANHCINQ